MNIYTHIFDEGRRRAAEQMDKRLGVAAGLEARWYPSAAMLRLIELIRFASRHVTPVGLLWAAAFIVGFALVLVWVAVPSPGGWPPWGEQKVAARVQIVALIVGVIGLGGVVLTVGAGVLEIRQIFLGQSLRVRTEHHSDSQGRIAPRRWRITIENGGSFVAISRVEVSASAMQGAVRRALRPVDGAGWGRDDTDVWMSVRSGEFYPTQRVEGPVFELADEDDSLIWSVRWWTERRGPESWSRLVRPDDPD